MYEILATKKVAIDGDILKGSEQSVRVQFLADKNTMMFGVDQFGWAWEKSTGVIKPYWIFSGERLEYAVGINLPQWDHLKIEGVDNIYDAFNIIRSRLAARGIADLIEAAGEDSATLSLMDEMFTSVNDGMHLKCR